MPDIEATIVYSIDDGVKPVTETVGPGGRLRRRTGVDDRRRVSIADARARPHDLDREGFTLVEHPSRTNDYWNEECLRRVYYAEITERLQNLCHGARVEIFDHTLRSTRSLQQEEHHAREPVHLVHNDYTVRSGPWRLEAVLPEAVGRGRFAIIQVWRSLSDRVHNHALALCDAQSVAQEDLIPAERRHPNRVGEIYQLRFNPNHRWFYFSEMEPEEAVVFKVYDSSTDGRARFTPHTAFADPDAPMGAERESIEIRALVCW